MPNGRDLTFINPGRPEMVLRRTNLPNLSPQVGPNQQAVAGIAENVGAGNYGNAFDSVLGYAAEYAGLPRSWGEAAGSTVRSAASGLSRGRQRAQTATNATRRGRNQTPPGAAGTNPPGRRRRRDNEDSSSRGGNPMVVGSDKVNIQLPTITGHLSTIEGGPLPKEDQQLDYVSQLHIAGYSLATWSADVGNKSLYNPDSIKNKQVALIFSRLLNDLYAQVTTKFTDDFTLVNFRKYMQTFITALEYITFIESVLAYDSKSGYSDKFIANEHLQEVYSSFEVIDTIKRLKSVMKNKYFPPKMVGLIHSTFQLHKCQNIEQSVNFRFCPIPDGIPILDNITQQNLPFVYYPQIRTNAINTMEECINILSDRDMTLVSKAIGFIRPSYIFNTTANPASAPVYSPSMVELMINLPRVYKTAATSTNRQVFPNAEVGEDRVYVVGQEVSQLNDVVFAMQSQPTTGLNTLASDFTNFGSTFAITSDFDSSAWGNFYSMVTKVLNGVTLPGFKLENSIESYAVGRSNILVYNGSPGTATPDKKYSITPSNCQRVYFNNTFAPTDAVRKLVDDILDMN